MKRLYNTFFTCLFLLSPSVYAHNFWLEAQPFYQQPDRHIDISVHVGQNMKGDLLPNIPAWYKEFDAITAEGLKEIKGEMGRDPAGYFYHETEGVYAIGYLSTTNTVELDAEHFRKYLKTQGLEKIIEQRKNSGDSDKEGREIYSRNVKTFVKIGTKNDVDFHQYDFGYPLNINPLKNPYDLKKGDSLRVQVTFNHKPAANLLIKSQIKNNADYRYSTRTDAQGYATIPIIDKGVWLISTVEMIPSNLYEIEWESFWGSMTFELR